MSLFRLPILSHLYVFLIVAVCLGSSNKLDSATAPESSSNVTSRHLLEEHVLIDPSALGELRMDEPSCETSLFKHCRRALQGQGPDNGALVPIIICSVVGVIVLLICGVGLVRFCISYRRTPRPDPVADAISRFELEREMEALKRDPMMLRRAQDLRLQLQDSSPGGDVLPPPPYAARQNGLRPPKYVRDEHSDIVAASSSRSLGTNNSRRSDSG